MNLAHLVLFNFFHGATPSNAPPASGTTPSGVRKGRAKPPLIRVNLRDVESRESTADFLKAQLRLRQNITEPVAPPSPRVSKAERLAKQKLEREALRNMEIERANEERRILAEQNNTVLTLLLIGSS